MITDDNTVSPDAAAQFFCELWPMYHPSKVAVEPMPFADSCPFAACIAWDDVKGRWHILVDTSGGPYETLRLAFHELHHLREKHIWPGVVGRPTIAERRAMARGEPAAVRKASANIEMARADAGHEPAEHGANDWAYARALEWWPILRDWKDATKAARVAWWVYNEMGGIE